MRVKIYPLTLAPTGSTKEVSSKITFRVTYYDLAGTQYTKDYNFYIKFVKSEETEILTGTSAIKITNITAPTGTFNVGQSATFTVNLKNTSGTDGAIFKVVLVIFIIGIVVLFLRKRAKVKKEFDFNLDKQELPHLGSSCLSRLKVQKV